MSDEKTKKDQPFVQLQLNWTQGSPYQFADSALTPWNIVNVYGYPGTTVSCSTGGGSDIVNDSNEVQAQPYSPMLVQGLGLPSGQGFTSFYVRMMYPENTAADTSEMLATSVNVYDSQNPSNFANGFPSFNLFSSAGQTKKNFGGYGWTTGAPNDGVTPCTLYVSVIPETGDGIKVTYVQVTIIESDSHAIIQSTGTKTAQIPLGNDGWITANILNTYKELITLRVVLPETSEGQTIYPPVPMDFSLFPR